MDSSYKHTELFGDEIIAVDIYGDEHIIYDCEKNIEAILNMAMRKFFVKVSFHYDGKLFHLFRNNNGKWVHHPSSIYFKSVCI